MSSRPPGLAPTSPDFTRLFPNSLISATSSDFVGVVGAVGAVGVVVVDSTWVTEWTTKVTTLKATNSVTDEVVLDGEHQSRLAVTTKEGAPSEIVCVCHGFSEDSCIIPESRVGGCNLTCVYSVVRRRKAWPAISQSVESHACLRQTHARGHSSGNQTVAANAADRGVL